MTSKLWLFLDIDGCMIAYPKGPGQQPEFFTPTAVVALSFLLEKLPDLVICLTSTMRYSTEGMSKLQRMFSSANLPWDRVKGETRIFEFDSTRWRREEIVHFCKHHLSKDDCMVVVDDQVIEGEKYFKIDPRRGLVISDAHDIITSYQAFITQDKELEKTLSVNNSMAGFGPTFIPLRDHEL